MNEEIHPCVCLSIFFCFRILPWNTGEITEPQWRSWGWDSLPMVAPSVWLHQTLALEPQPAVQHQLVHTHVKLASGPTMRWSLNKWLLTQLKDIYHKTFHWHFFCMVFQICTFLKGTTIQWIDDQKVPYASKNNEWVGFDTRESYEIKVQ